MRSSVNVPNSSIQHKPSKIYIPSFQLNNLPLPMEFNDLGDTNYYGGYES